MAQFFHTVYASPIGPLTLRAIPHGLTHILFGEELVADSSNEVNNILAETIHQLNEYFAGMRRTFSVPLAPKGTDFQKQVWQALVQIPYGETRTYGQIASQIEKPKACRAVGLANHCNPIPILIPCHRVIGASGQLTGYAGGLTIKKTLLAQEGLLFK